MLVVEVLDGKKHDRSAFNCDNPELNYYLKKEASQDVKNGYCQVYVVVEDTLEESLQSKHRIYGFFALSSYVIDRYTSKQKYKSIPSILLGRLAKEKNQTLISGAELLLLALNKAKEAKEMLGGAFIITHPKDRRAKDFYMRHGFIELPSNDKTLVMHTKDIPN